MDNPFENEDYEEPMRRRRRWIPWLVLALVVFAAATQPGWPLQVIGLSLWDGWYGSGP